MPKKQKSKPHFIAALSIVTVFCLLMIGLGLLYYYDIERDSISKAEAATLPKEYLFTRAEEEGLDANLLNRIIECESKWKMVANKKSTAYGYFQILDRTERSTPQYQRGLRKTDPLANIDMGIYLFKRYGTQPWKESQKCWGYS